MERKCQRCGQRFDAQRATAKFCGSNCRSLASQERKGTRAAPVVTLDAGPEPSVGTCQAATRAFLDARGLLDHPLAFDAIILAARMDAGGDSGSSMAAMAKARQSIINEISAGARVAADPVDELGRLREQRRGA